MIDDAEIQLAAALQGIPLEQAALMRRAQRSQGLLGTPMPQGQQVGRVYKASSPLEHLAAAFSRFQGGREAQEVDRGFGDLATRAGQAGTAQARLQAARRQEDIAREQAEKDRSFGLQERGLERQIAADASASARAQADAAERARHNRAVEARQQTELVAGARPPAGYRFTPDGNLEAIPGGPADLKTQADAQRRADGATDVDVALATLRDAYARLEKGGGITSTESGALSNIGASISSSGPGQWAGKVLGTDNQSARNDITMARPALLAALMKATGMSARQMDSNAELKLWITTATDPTLDVEANRRALANIERKYLGTGGGGSPAATAAPARKTVNGKTYEKRSDGWYEVP